MVDLSINSENTTEKIIQFIKNTVNKSGFTKAVIGLSGGIDSTVSFYLAVKALGRMNVYPCLLPFGDFDKDGLKDAGGLVLRLNIPKENLFFTDLSLLLRLVLKIDEKMSNIRKGNIIARFRMILLYDWARKNNALVIGTENKTENILGYYTRFGDEASDLEPVISLYKTQVKQLASFLGVSQNIINKSPTAGLWIGQSDEKDFGFTYDEADKILFLYFDKENSIEEIVSRGFSRKTIEKILKRVKENSYKKTLPVKCKLG